MLLGLKKTENSFSFRNTDYRKHRAAREQRTPGIIELRGNVDFRGNRKPLGNNEFQGNRELRGI